MNTALPDLTAAMPLLAVRAKPCRAEAFRLVSIAVEEFYGWIVHIENRVNHAF